MVLTDTFADYGYKTWGGCEWTLFIADGVFIEVSIEPLDYSWQDDNGAGLIQNEWWKTTPEYEKVMNTEWELR